jgi:hypothetical protein
VFVSHAHSVNIQDYSLTKSTHHHPLGLTEKRKERLWTIQIQKHYHNRPTDCHATDKTRMLIGTEELMASSPHEMALV